MVPHVLLIASAACLIAASPAPAAATEVARFKIGVEVDGVHRISHRDLRAAGFTNEEVPVAGVRLRTGDRSVPVHVEGGHDGIFGADDAIFFLGHHLEGETTYAHPYAEYRPYYLELASEPRPRAAAMPAPPNSGAERRSFATLATEVHFEPSQLMVRFGAKADPVSQREAMRRDVWYWKSLSMAQDPTRLTLGLPEVDADAAQPISLSVHLRGWSELLRKPGTTPDHRIEILIGDRILATSAWEGQQTVTLNFLVDPSNLDGDDLPLVLRVPKRVDPASGTTLVDAVLLDWIKAHYPVKERLGSNQVRLLANLDAAPRVSTRASSIRVFSSRGDLVAEEHAPRRESKSEYELEISVAEAWVVPQGSAHQPGFIARYEPVDLLATPAEYLVISHRSLISAIQPLVDFHRRRGLKVVVADVERVFDQFREGIAEPAAIKRFLQAAHAEWEEPALRYVLLVGDASWDTRGEGEPEGVYLPRLFRPAHTQRTRSQANRPKYDEKLAPRQRNLVPAWRYAGPSGYAASDNWLVALNPESNYPVVALGRIPAVSAGEVSDYVAKAIRYAQRQEVGPWRREVFLISNQLPEFQESSDGIANALLGSGLVGRRHYPAPQIEVEDYDRKAVRRGFDRGSLAVHFWGHGGRFIWRTGPPDLKHNRDLFTLADLDELAEESLTSIVLSMTCFSAPFDHPTADSIGEKLLRLPGKGAVAVVAASWRTSPNPRMSEALLKGLLREETIGDAFLRAKTRARNATNLAIFNLLGDPALPIDHPPTSIEIEVDPSRSGGFLVEVPDELVGGRLIAEWVGEGLAPVETQEYPISEQRLEITSGDAPAGSLALHLYGWNDDARVDGLGGLRLSPRPAVASGE